MTIIAAMKEGVDSILIAADSEYEESGQIRLGGGARKLKRHPTGMLAWGISGNTTLGEIAFCEWVQAYSWPPPDWRTFERTAITELSRLIGEQRKLVELSKAQPNPAHDAAECLLVGWIGDIPEIYQFGDGGQVQSYLSDGFSAIGKGNIAAWVSYLTMRNFKGVTELTKLRAIMNVITHTIAGCGGEYYIWRVKKEIIETSLEKSE
jgi:hypothetical protein